MANTELSKEVLNNVNENIERFKAFKDRLINIIQTVGPKTTILSTPTRQGTLTPAPAQEGEGPRL